MSPFRCSLCFQASIEFPQEFKAVLIDFIKVFSKFQPCSLNDSDGTNLNLCRSCWVHFMRIHKLDQQLSVQKESCEAKGKQLLLKIRQGQRSLQKIENNLTSWEDDVQILAAVQNDPLVGGHTQDTDSVADNDQLVTAAYENKWLPKNFSLPKSPTVVKRLSEIDFIYMGKYPFQGTEAGFKCGLCSAVCKFHKRPPIWDNINSHIRIWHMENPNGGAMKVCRKLKAVAPSSSSSRNIEDNDSDVRIQSEDKDSEVVGRCSSRKSDDSDSESIESCKFPQLSNTSSSSVCAKVVEKDPVDRTSVDDGDCESHEAERMTLPKDFEVQILENHEEEDVEVCGRSQDADSAVVAGCSSNKSDDDSETESLDSCATADSTSTESSGEEEETTEKGSADKTISEAVKPSSSSVIAYENKWLPFNLTKLQYSPVVKRLSEVDFINDDKYPFQGTEIGFKCGLCPSLCAFYKHLPIWSNMVDHMKRWHRGKGACRVRSNKVLQRFIEIAPNRFQYGKYFVGKIDESYRCEECGEIKAAATGSKNKAAKIMEHINRWHENGKTHVCEYCGKVFKYLHGLRDHRLTQHEKPSDTFPCSDCDKTFVSRTKALHHHKVVHQGIYKGKKLICEICGKACAQKVALENHVAFVHKGQKIECKDCGKMFASQSALATHRSSHTGKKYTCDICAMEFTQHYSVTRHKKTAHPQ